MRYLSKAVVGIVGFSTVAGNSSMPKKFSMKRSEKQAVSYEEVTSMKGSVLYNSTRPKNNTSVSRMPKRICETLLSPELRK